MSSDTASNDFSSAQGFSYSEYSAMSFKIIVQFCSNQVSIMYYS